jgi:DNA-binding beta-propeller fold protein YncE
MTFSWTQISSKAGVTALLALTVLVALLPKPAQAKQPKTSKKQVQQETVEPLLLEGNRRLEFIRSFSSEEEVRTKKPFWSKVLDFVAGPAEIRRMVRPYDIAADSQGRLIVTDPGAPAVHIFDFKKQKYQNLTGSKKEEFKSPIGVAVDAEDNIYVSDSELGKIFVFDGHGKFRHYLGDIKGEGYFKRPTGLAIDSASKRIYVTDTLRNAVYSLDFDGNILGHFGKAGEAAGEFNYPTEIQVRGDELIVADAMNFRVQIFDRNGTYRQQFGHLGNVTGAMFRSKGLALDSEGNIYLADAFLDIVQVFNRKGDLLFYFGAPGTGAAQFQLPAGVHIDRDNKVYVADSYNRRVQVFQYIAASSVGPGGAH